MQVLARDVPTLLRRLLLVLVTALIVARPLVHGEDPGLTANLADPWGMVLTLLWLLAAVAWAAWRFWLREEANGRCQPAVEDPNSRLMPAARLTAAYWYGGMVQTALLLTVALVFVSAEAAAAYKFPARLIAWEWFGLFVSFLVVRQLAVTPREQHGLFTVVLAGAAALAVQGVYQKGVELPHGHAALLVLGLPGLIGAVAVSRRTNAPKWQTILTALCVVLGLSALGLAAAGNPIRQRLGPWQTAWQMIQERPWLGVGPGNFGENYTRLMPADAEAKIAEPHNFALEMGATCGIFALLALLAALTAFFYQVVRQLRRAEGVSPLLRCEQGADAPRSPEVRWEFYLGGMFGLLLGFVLRVNTASPENILTETYAAAVRSVAWFAAFALLERVAWTNRSRTLALTVGIAALLLVLCVWGGIGFPTVAGPLWIAVALALNAAALRPDPWLSRAGVAMIVPLPIFLGLFLGYGVYILYPVLAADDLVREAMLAVAYFQSERAKPFSERSAGIRNSPIDFLDKGVIGRLNQAAQLTPDDARIYVQLALWNSVAWELGRQKTRRELPIAERALRYGVQATQLDPHGATGYLVQYQVRMRYAEICQGGAEELRKQHGDPLNINKLEITAREQAKLAADALEQYLPNDPHDAALHYALWNAWHKAGDKEKAHEYAEEALQLDDLAPTSARKLTDFQRKQIEDWLANPKGAPGKESP